MFRRFMIVCWVIFALMSVVSLLGHAGCVFYDTKAEELYDMGLNRFAKFDEKGEFLDLNSDDVLLEIVQNSDNVYSRMMAMAELDRRYYERKNRSKSVRLNAVILAAILLLWNLFWHTGHWIWMGRKPK